MNYSLLLQASGEGMDYTTMIFIGVMFVVMYFFFIRPQQKKAKKAQAFRESLEKGDKVVTIGGIHGKIVDIADSTVLISCESGKLRVEKSAVSSENTASEQDIQQKS